MYTVYQHMNLRNGKSYIGMTSLNPKYRWNNGNGYQNNSKMWNDIQNSDWNTDWKHSIIRQFEDKDEALKYEAFLIAMLGTVRNGYNTSSYGGTSYKRTDETRKKISDNHADFSGEKHPMFGKHHSEETKKKMSESQIGKHFSEEHNNKISQSKGVNGILQFSKNGEFIAEYPSIHEAERQTGCNNSHICECCKGKRKSASGYIWKYKEI